MKVKMRFAFAVLRVMLPVGLLILPFCSCGFFGVPDYELTVTVGNGVQGSPENGPHVYQDLTKVDYAYTAVNPLHTVEVIYDGVQTYSSGTITIYTSVTLEARLVDIRDAWTLTLYDTSNNKLIEAEITFAGADVLGGTFSDSRGLTGSWDGTSNVVTITYGNWERYILTGTLFEMKGTWANGDVTGSWVAVRKTS